MTVQETLRSLRTGEQREDDLLPLLLKRCLRDRLSCLPIPVARIFRVAFLTVQVGVNPCRCLGGASLLSLGLGDLMSSIPIPFGIPPQGGQQRRQLRRRSRVFERDAKLLKRHSQHSMQGGVPPVGIICPLFGLSSEVAPENRRAPHGYSLVCPALFRICKLDQKGRIVNMRPQRSDFGKSN